MIDFVKHDEERKVEDARLLNLPRKEQLEYVKAQKDDFHVNFYRLMFHCHEVNKRSSGDNLVYIAKEYENYPENMHLYFTEESIAY